MTRPEPAVATNYVGGEWRDAARTSDVLDPADSSAVGTVAVGNAEDADAAADAAAAAFGDWATAPGRVRADLLDAVADGLLARADELGRLLSRESGKLVAEGIGEITFSAEYFRWFAEQARRPPAETIAAEARRRVNRVTTRPSGVALCLTPWNFPVSIQARKLAAALAAGCTTVSRVSEKAPLAATALFAVLANAGLPAGVANLVHGPAAELTDTLLAHPAVRVVSFTGSTPVGIRIMRAAAERMVRPALELGGDAPYVVFDDADLTAAADGAMIAKFRNNGQSCIGANRFLVQAEVADEFIALLRERVGSMTVGNPASDPAPTLGPLIDAERVAAVTKLVDEATAAGAARIGPDPDALPSGGQYVAPALFTGVPDDAGMATQEVFGPVAGIWTFDSDDEGLARAADTTMGLAGYAWTTDLARAERCQAELPVGILGINTPVPSTATAPMGGVAMSGLGREGGDEGMREFLDVHYAAVSW